MCRSLKLKEKLAILVLVCHFLTCRRHKIIPLVIDPESGDTVIGWSPNNGTSSYQPLFATHYIS